MKAHQGKEEYRDSLVTYLVSLLQGPLQPDEVLQSNPSDTYLTGILWPRGTELGTEDDGSTLGGGSAEEEEVDAGVPGYRTIRPCSIGLTFSVLPGARMTISLKDTSRYLPRATMAPDAGAAGNDSGSDREASRGAKFQWTRMPLDYRITLDSSPDASVARKHEFRNGAGLEVTDNAVRVDVKQRPRDGLAVVTITLINDALAVQGTSRDELSLFQAGIEVTALLPDGSPAIVARQASLQTDDDDIRSNALLYRGALEYATGHGVAADWDDPNGNRTGRVSTTWLPRQSVAATSPKGHRRLRELRKKNSAYFSAAWLSRSGEQTEITAFLEAFAQAYDDWIRVDLGTVLDSLPPDMAEIGRGHIGRCKRAHQRMLRGVEILRTSSLAWRAFSLANEAMDMQARFPSKGERAGPLSWHPFQLAFLLLAIPSIVNEDDEDREVMDLLWFPTGGGKTEAYLGLTAFTIFFKRLSSSWRKQDGGVDVLMRYTLRLLTVQQFQRAAALIVACDQLRKNNAVLLGEARISLGLYVGGETTPNKIDDARKAIAEECNGGSPTCTPRLLLECPECGNPLGPEQYDFPEGSQQMLVSCAAAECGTKGMMLPIMTVDDAIYVSPPSLLIGTVDKFAQLPRKGEIRRLFGRDTPERPSLIIQDELHLISGPLGSIAGLYESTIDLLCTDSAGRKPKIVGSTATIGRARKQVRALFDREVFQFPPPGLNASDSFFSVRDDEGADRLYVGVASAGRSPKFALQAVIATLMQSIHYSLGKKAGTDKDADPYWTCLTYFNSLRELGGAYVMLQDDVPKTMRFLARRLGGTVRPMATEPKELSSRVHSNHIPHRLRELGFSLGGDDDYAPVPIDAVLASNMISVGVDIPRLGLMVVNGQPKSTAEYIQATSRVGRGLPGLVVTVQNVGRPRDLSHFEHFRNYHQALYRSVEATSVTPWAPRARDKALHAVVIAAVRHLVDGLLMDEDAIEFDGNNEEVVRIREMLIQRAQTGTDGLETAETRRDLQRILSTWTDRSEHLRIAQGKLRYWAGKGAAMNQPHLMRDAERVKMTDSSSWATPNSMREIEPSTVFILKKLQ